MPARDKSTRERPWTKNRTERDRSSTQTDVPITGQEAESRTSESGAPGRSMARTPELVAPFRMMRELSDDMSRFFHNFGFGTNLIGRPLDQPFAIPQVDVLRRGDALVVRADLPGLSKDDVSVDVSGDILTIRGEREKESREEREGYYWHERSSGSFSRRIPLPENADTEHASARFENGVLEVTMPVPETEESRSRRIEIS
jgi:HSP20 family protein